MFIFRTYITTKDGRKLYAKNYGKKAFVSGSTIKTRKRDTNFNQD